MTWKFCLTDFSAAVWRPFFLLGCLRRLFVANKDMVKEVKEHAAKEESSSELTFSLLVGEFGAVWLVSVPAKLNQMNY